jgi:hypothetical protein
MVILVCGGRDFDDAALVDSVLTEVVSWSLDGIVKIVEGDARGADRLAGAWARAHGYGEHLIEVPVAMNAAHRAETGAQFDWVTHGRGAGPMRNQWMIDHYHPDQGVVFQGGNGTADCLERMFRAGMNVWVVGC